MVPPRHPGLIVGELVSVEEDWSALRKVTEIEEGPFEGPSSQFLRKAIGEERFQKPLLVTS